MLLNVYTIYTSIRILSVQLSTADHANRIKCYDFKGHINSSGHSAPAYFPFTVY
jgi:hypothetical protein